MTKRYSRKEIINLLKDNRLTKKEIAALADEDKLFAEILSNFPKLRDSQLFDAPEVIINKAIALAGEKSKSAKDWVASLILDSWVTPQVAGVRGVATSNERRLRYEYDSCMFDIRAEKMEKEWYFVAQLTGLENLQDVTVKVDNKNVFVNDLGCFEWKAKKTPSNISVLIKGNQIFELPELSWKNKS